VHLRPLPGDPEYRSGGFEQVLDDALRDCVAMLEGGIRQMIVENFGSAPFRKGTPDDPLDPHVHAFMARVVDACREEGAMVGVNCLRNDVKGALGIAAATGAYFVRANVLSGAYVTDQGIIEGDAASVLRYRKALGIDNVSILADVLVKHATPLGELEIEQAVRDTVARGGADAVIVSGSGTGASTDLELFRRARQVTSAPIFVGSGVTRENVAEYADAEGLIVGTALKEGGWVRNPVEEDRVRAIVDAWQASR
jgi:membrane complex biogenesis BtpA family protein